jgi:hypothetical protein
MAPRCVDPWTHVTGTLPKKHYSSGWTLLDSPRARSPMQRVHMADLGDLTA